MIRSCSSASGTSATTSSHPGQPSFSENPRICPRRPVRSRCARGVNSLGTLMVTAKVSGAKLTVDGAESLRDEAASLIDSLLVQDEQYQLWLASWQGASQSVLDGVQTREAMDSYIHRAAVAAQQ